MGRGLIRARMLLPALLLLAGACAQAGELPPIIATADNAVPSCVRPEALMQFVSERNARQQPPRKMNRVSKVSQRFIDPSASAWRGRRNNAWESAGTMLFFRC
jgi:hypothetical protein